MPACFGASRKVYGARKVRQMGRSVLPSTARVMARSSLAGVRRPDRRSIHGHLTSYRGSVGAVLDRVLDDEANLCDWPRHTIRDVVTQRRDADKVAPLQRWAVARTRHLPQPDRLPSLRSAVPSTLIGRHALSHLTRLPELRNPRLPPTWLERAIARSARSASRTAQLDRQIRRAFEDGRHGALNEWIKAHDGSGTPRLLLGAHDLDAFCRAMAISSLGAAVQAFFDVER